MTRPEPVDQGPRGSASDEEVRLTDIWLLLARNRLVILLTTLAVVAAAFTFNSLSVPVYEATASIRIVEERTDLPVLDILQTLSTGSEVETEMEVLRSRSLAEAVVDSLGLQVRVSSPRGVSRVALLDVLSVERNALPGRYRFHRQSGGTFEVRPDDGGAALVMTIPPGSLALLPGATLRLTEEARLLETLVIDILDFDFAVEELRDLLLVARPNRDASIVTVHYESTDTQLVHTVPNILAAQFIDRGSSLRKVEATSTVRFLEQQIDTLARQLLAAEEALTQFREAEQVVSLRAEAESQVTQLTHLQAERNILDTERQALQELVDEIASEATRADPSAVSPYTRLISFPTLFRNQAASELLRSLNEANTLRSQLLERRLPEDPDVINVSARIQEIEEQLRVTASTYLQGLTNQVQAYDRTLGRFGSELEAIPAKEVQLARLQRDTDVLNEVFTLLQSRLQEVRILEAVEDATVRILDPAILPSEPSRPRKALNLLFGLLVGAGLGVSVGVTRELLDETVHTRDDVVHATRGVPVLGLIPRIHEEQGAAKRGGRSLPGELGAHLVAGRDPRNPVSEAYRSLRTNLTFANPDQPPRTIVFTSALPRDGKSTTAANLSITLAQQGILTLLVDADLRRGGLHTVFGIPREPGLTNVLAGGVDLEEAIQKIDLGQSGALHFLPAGVLPPNPAEVLGSDRMRSIITRLEESFDLVVFDSTPLTVVTDAAVLGTKVDGVVLVARASQTAKGALQYAMEQLRTVRASVLGSVLNDVDFRRDARYRGSYGRYGYLYQYYYGEASSRRT